MKPETIERKMDEIADEVGGHVYKGGYSGRFMYGRSCYGIVCGNATECIEVAARKGIRGASTDNLGLDYIVYWPHLKYGEKVKEDGASQD